MARGEGRVKNDVNEGIGEWGDWGKLGQTSWGTLICLSYEGGRLSTGHWVTPAVVRTHVWVEKDIRTPELLSVDQ